eukprot:TRINITY_DN2480_c4_g1_i1.p1 TRINITY_DN2480_c4_g1~~TRINITY_DN2480_c4_g1_i1.p1  ORF type:complete len:201 (+),score=45.93 TRINITY_DN2480_c4_g1_i1:58-660(+)
MTTDTASTDTLQVFLVGEPGVGKTSLLLHFTGRPVATAFVPTLGVDSLSQTVTVKGKEITLVVTDTAGQERFQSVISSQFKRADAILVVYDICDTVSFHNLKQWFQEIRTHAREEIPRILVGNKKDREGERTVTTKQGADEAVQLNVPFIETSAKTGENVKEAFIKLAELCLKVPAPEAPAAAPVKVGRTEEEKKHKSCC